MKTLYKIIIFFAMFQMSILVINATGVFGNNTFYSDAELGRLQNMEDPTVIIGYIFGFPEIPGVPAHITVFGFPFLIAAFTIAGAIYAWKTHSYAPITIVVIAGAFLPMIAKSLGFFQKMFTNWETAASSLMYIGIALSVGIFIIAIITIIEMPTHGRS
jgi:hypothetical protein